MFLKTIDKYIIGELIKMFLISIFAMTMVLYLDKFLFMAEMIVNRGVSSIELFMMMVYISPAFLAITIPMAVLMASVVTFNQFSAHNEWIAMKACNMSFMELMKPVLFFSLFAYFLANIVMFWALPWGNQSYKVLVYDIIKNRANVDIKPNVFNRDFKNLILLVKERQENSSLKGVFIADTSKPESPQIITSEEGVIFSNRETLKIQLKLNNGTIHDLSNQGSDYQTLNFDRYDINLSLPDTERLEQEALVGNRELSFPKIIEKIKEMKKKGLPTSGPEVELSKKFSIPFTCLLFAFLGAPLGIKSSRSGKSGSFGITLAVIMLYYVGLIMTQNLGRIGKIHSYTSVWIPNAILIVVVVYVLYKMQKELPFKFLEVFVGLLMTVVEFFKRLFGKNNKILSSKRMGNRKSISARPTLDGIDQLRKVSNHRKQG
ncbi:MAG: YjgP/YjgQ family permease [Nitrospina sp.]|jgi:lipopolysaccharide export system permease protein|nr:YjgP/YjgQ family permease [Nitrospina sp.]MBT5632457.1 YjgP/YjgQ family permease [Nitrospina sp.]